MRRMAYAGGLAAGDGELLSSGTVMVGVGEGGVTSGVGDGLVESGDGLGLRASSLGLFSGGFSGCGRCSRYTSRIVGTTDGEACGPVDAGAVCVTPEAGRACSGPASIQPPAAAAANAMAQPWQTSKARRNSRHHS